MATYGYNELIWHFAGYFHTINEIATIRYEYGPAYTPDLTIPLDNTPLNSTPDNNNDPDGGRLHSASNIPDSFFPNRSEILITDEVLPSLFDDPDLTTIIDSVFDPILPANLDTDIPDNDFPTSFTISLLYRIIGPQNYTYLVSSTNNLTDNDFLIVESLDSELYTEFSVEELISNAVSEMPSDDYLETLKELAGEQVPAFLTLDMEELEQSTMELADSLASRILAIAEVDDETEGVRFENAETAPISNEGSARNASNEEAEENFTEADEGEMPLDMSEGEELPSEMADDEDLPEPEQTIHLGSNEAVNAASIVDTSEAGASFVILGDYFESNAIVQTNIYSFNDNNSVGSALNGASMAGDIMVADNAVTNDAEFIREAGDFSIPAPLGFSLPAYNFSVDYVVGDFFDLNLIKQLNDLTDNDTTIFETQTNQYLISTGDNSLVNAAQLLDLYQQYDMIFINGSYHEINFIQQTNIVIDADSVTFSGFGDDVSYDNNILENEATIQNFGGGELFRPLTDDIEALTSSIANFEDTLTYTNSEIDFGMAVNTPFEVSVLYVTGDFYQLNAIFQTNILSDIDAGLIVNGDFDDRGLTQNVEAADNEEASDPVYETGENLASNQASIIDYDSQSEFQYLDGDFYEHDILIQVDLIAPEDEAMMMANLAHNDGLVNEVIAFAGDEYPENYSENEPLFTPTQDAGEGADMMGNMMA